MSFREEAKVILRGARVQNRVIVSLILRELGARFGRYYFGYFWLFVEPLLFAAVIGFVHYLRDRPTLFGPFEFFAVGYVMFFIFRGILSRAPMAIPANRPLLFHRFVTLPDIFFARHIIEFFACSGVLLLMLAGLYAANGSLPESPIKVLGALILMTLLSQGIAFIWGSISEAIDGAARVLQVVTFLFLPVGGLFFLVEWLPSWAQEIVLWIPTVHVFELLRDGQFGSRFRPIYDVSYIMAWIVVTHLIGLAALRITRERLGIEKALSS
jgi:capsular polysaccharide transport system permease protein